MNDTGGVVRKGKTLGDVSWFQSDFTSRAQEFLDRQHAVENAYTSGEKREGCILCGAPLAGPIRYSRGSVDYTLCSNCGHLNGLNDLSDYFIEFAYGGCTGSSAPADSRPYASEFSTGRMKEQFDEVVRRIYLPKVSFLEDVLATRTAASSADLKVIDFGCGGGHFVEALRLAGFSDVSGVDSLPEAVAEAVDHGLQDCVSLVPVDGVKDYLAASEADIISMMCVLPHLQEPVRVLEAMRAGGVRWTFQKLPMWSFATLLEAAFPEFPSRVLAMDHTHVFTWASLDWLENHIGLRRVGSWSFGSDALDLSRKMMQRLSVAGTDDFAEWSLATLELGLEGIQSALDQCGLSSEIHIVWEFSENT